MKKVQIVFFLLAALSLNAQKTVKTTTTNLNLRKSPNTKCDVITVIPKGTTVKIDMDCD